MAACGSSVRQGKSGSAGDAFVNSRAGTEGLNEDNAGFVRLQKQGALVQKENVSVKPLALFGL